MTESTAEFFEAWSLYDQILDLNAMFHDEIFDDIRSMVEDRFGCRPFTILDLGCGSARHVSSALAGRQVAAYLGYDLSEAALAHARVNLKRIGCPVELRTGDLLEAVEGTGGRYDVILSSFAIHHLSAEKKRRLFQAVAGRLDPGGILLLVDTFRDEGEDRSTYLDRYCRWIRTSWRGLPDDAPDAIIAHVREHDFPETASGLAEMASDAGLVPSGEGRQFGWHRSFGFERRLVGDRPHGAVNVP